MKLNSNQKKAVETTEGPLLVFAGAGSGKTRVITNRIASMVLEKQIPAGSIVALSFTNKSAGEMKERLRKMVPKEKLKGIVLSTFHSLGLRILKEHIQVLGYGEKFILFNANDQESFVSDLIKLHKLDPKKIPPKDVIKFISLQKNTQGSSGAQNETGFDELFAILEDYQSEMKKRNTLDFDDLILLPKEILKKHPEIAKSYHKKFHYFMVDEFQDTNQLQYDFLTLFRGESQNLCVVGDDDQSIYAFRGSNVELILNFEREFPGATVVRLLENYRSAAPIIQAANSLIKNNKSRKEKELYSLIPSTELVSDFEVSDEKEEAVFVASQIQSYLVKNEYQGNQIAILFRTNYQSRPFEEELRNRNIPYKVVGGYNFFDRKEVRDCIAYLRCIANHKDDLSLQRILNYPKRGIGSGSLQILLAEAQSKGIRLFEVFLRICESPDYLPEVKAKVRQEIYQLVEILETYQKKFFQADKMSLVLKELIQQVGLENAIRLEEEEEKIAKARIYNLSELVNMMSFFEAEEDKEEAPTLFSFLIRLSLLMEDDPKEEEGKEDRRVQLLTMHQSKGLEFDLVFVVGLEEGILPNSRVMDNPESVDEERRLLYVAMTRPRRKLYLTHSQTRRKFGEQMQAEPSRFLLELDRSVVDFHPLGEMPKEEAIEGFLADLEKLKVC